MANEGWISLHRQLQDHFLWKEKPFGLGQAWVDLILLANHRDTKRLWRGELKEYKRGTVNASIAFLADRWGWSWRKVKRFLKTLENDGMITLSVTPRETAIFLTNYDFFQGERRANVRADVTPDVRADVTQTIMNNNLSNNVNKGRSRGNTTRTSLNDVYAEAMERAKREDEAWLKDHPEEAE